MAVSYRTVTFECLGHSSVRIESEDGTVLYVDPWSGVLDSTPNDGAIVFVTHDDADHYDIDAIEAVATPDATVAAYEAVDTSDLSFDVVDLGLDSETTVDEIAVRSVPAYNDPAGTHTDDHGSPYHAEGEVIGLLLTIDDTTVFFASDTDYLPHHDALSMDVLVLPIGGHYTMNRHDAAAFARSVGPELVLPVHYDTFEAIETDADAFVDELAAAGIESRLFCRR